MPYSRRKTSRRRYGYSKSVRKAPLLRGVNLEIKEVDFNTLSINDPQTGAATAAAAFQNQNIADHSGFGKNFLKESTFGSGAANSVANSDAYPAHVVFCFPVTIGVGNRE